MRLISSNRIRRCVKLHVQHAHISAQARVRNPTAVFAERKIKKTRQSREEGLLSETFTQQQHRLLMLKIINKYSKIMKEQNLNNNYYVDARCLL